MGWDDDDWDDGIEAAHLDALEAQALAQRQQAGPSAAWGGQAAGGAGWGAPYHHHHHQQQHQQPGGAHGQGAFLHAPPPMPVPAPALGYQRPGLAPAAGPQAPGMRMPPFPPPPMQQQQQQQQQRAVSSWQQQNQAAPASGGRFAPGPAHQPGPVHFAGGAGQQRQQQYAGQAAPGNRSGGGGSGTPGTHYEQQHRQHQQPSGSGSGAAQPQKKQASLYSMWGSKAAAGPASAGSGRGGGGWGPGSAQPYTAPLATSWQQQQQQQQQQGPGGMARPGFGQAQPGSSSWGVGQQQEQQQHAGAAVGLGPGNVAGSGAQLGSSGVDDRGAFKNTAAAMRALQPADQQERRPLQPTAENTARRMQGTDARQPAPMQWQQQQASAKPNYQPPAQQPPAPAMHRPLQHFLPQHGQQDVGQLEERQQPADAPIDLCGDDEAGCPAAAAGRHVPRQDACRSGGGGGMGLGPIARDSLPLWAEPLGGGAGAGLGCQEALTPLGASLLQQQQQQQQQQHGLSPLGDGTSEAEGPGMEGPPGKGYLVDVQTTTGGIQLHSFNARQWVYPKGVQERAYQLACIQTALLNNTLVCLPTGLGKTLIAAVVMHNFARWFPKGKVVFVAPTRPLVNQQIDACYSFMGVSKTAMAELTGNVKAEERQRLWQQEHMRIFFATPQTFWNDVKKGICPYEQVVCLIVDECHRATGNYDIVNAVKHMRQHKCKFRVVGLSATPGSDAGKVQEVIDNLMICKVEHRAESDPEVQPHVHHKDIQLEVVEPTREVEHLRTSLLHLLRNVIGQLCSAQAFFGPADPERVSRFLFLTMRNKYGERGGQTNYGIVQLFQQGMFLSDLRDQVDLYGLNSALAYLNDKMADKGGARQLASNPIFAQFRQQLESCARNCAQSPKMKKLIDVLRAHFQEGATEPGSVGRVIIFTNLRESVNEIVDCLRPHEPLITARMFIGQGGGTSKSGGAGMKQREQKAVLGDFRAAKFNVLVATSIGEEGLDIPQVDLIVCYDATASPTRAIQRMGRTGRHKDGRVVYILAAGREKEKYDSIEENMRQLHRKLRSADSHFNFYKPNPRMLPREFDPRRLDVAVQHLTPEKGGGEEKASGRGRGRGSGKACGSGRGRGSGPGGKAAADEVAGIGAEEGAELALDDLEEGAGAAAASGRGRGAKRGRSSGTRSRGRGRAAASARGAKPAEVIEIGSDESGDELGRPLAGPQAAAAANLAESLGSPGLAAAATTGGLAEDPWSPMDYDMPPPASPVLGLLGEPGGQSPGLPAAAGAAEAVEAAAPLHSPVQQQQQQQQQATRADADQPAAMEVEGAQPAQEQQQPEQQADYGSEFQLLFPESATVLSWDPSGRFFIAPPLPLHQLLQPAAGPAAGEEAGPRPAMEADGEEPEAAAAAPGPGTAGAAEGRVQPPHLSSQGLHVGAGVVLKLDDSGAHRWAFVAALGVQRAAPAELNPRAEGVAPAAEGGSSPAAIAEAVKGKSVGNAGGKPSGVVGRKSGKAAAKPSKPRKRKPKVPTPPLEPPPAVGEPIAVAAAAPPPGPAEQPAAQPEPAPAQVAPAPQHAPAEPAAPAPAPALPQPALLPSHQGGAGVLAHAAAGATEGPPRPSPAGSPAQAAPPAAAKVLVDLTLDDSDDEEEPPLACEPMEATPTYSQLPLGQRLAQRQAGVKRAAGGEGGGAPPAVPRDPGSPLPPVPAALAAPQEQQQQPSVPADGAVVGGQAALGGGAATLEEQEEEVPLARRRARLRASTAEPSTQPLSKGAGLSPPAAHRPQPAAEAVLAPAAQQQLQPASEAAPVSRWAQPRPNLSLRPPLQPVQPAPGPHVLAVQQACLAAAAALPSGSQWSDGPQGGPVLGAQQQDSSPQQGAAVAGAGLAAVEVVGEAEEEEEEEEEPLSRRRTRLRRSQATPGRQGQASYVAAQPTSPLPSPPATVEHAAATAAATAAPVPEPEGLGDMVAAAPIPAEEPSLSGAAAPEEQDWGDEPYDYYDDYGADYQYAGGLASGAQGSWQDPAAGPAGSVPQRWQPQQGAAGQRPEVEAAPWGQPLGGGHQQQQPQRQQHGQGDAFTFASHPSPLGSGEDSPWGDDASAQGTPRLCPAPAAAAHAAPADPVARRLQPAMGEVLADSSPSCPPAAGPPGHSSLEDRGNGQSLPPPAQQQARPQVDGLRRQGSMHLSQTPQWGGLARAGPAAKRAVLEDTPGSEARGGPGASQTPGSWQPPPRALAATRRGAVVGDTPEGLAENNDAGDHGMGQPPARKRLKRAGGQQQQQQAAVRPGNGAGRGAPPHHGARARALLQQKRKASRFIDMEAGVSEDEPVSGDEEEEDDGFLQGFIDDGTQAPPSTGGRSDPMSVYRRPLFRGAGAGGPSPSPLGQFRSMLGRLGRGRQPVQDTPGASQQGAGVDEEDDYDYEDSFLATEDGEGEGSGAPEESHEGACAVCRGEEGELLLCDGCPAVYHPRCCGLRSVPEGDWYCPLCADERTPRHTRRRAGGGHRQQQPQSTARGGERAGGAQRRQEPPPQEQRAAGAGGGGGGAAKPAGGYGPNGGAGVADEGYAASPGGSWGGFCVGTSDQEEEDPNTFSLL